MNQASSKASHTRQPSNDPITVLVADDHSMMRAGLCNIINSTPGLRVTATAHDGTSTLEQLSLQHFDLLLLDLSMPAPSGVELIRLVRQRYPEQHILVVTMHNNPRIARAAIDAGASGYITKDNDPELLLEAVTLVGSGGRYVEPRLMEAMLFSPPPAPQARLTPRETEVMRRLANGQSHSEIARALFLSEKTVSTHKVNLMSKLELRNLADIVRYASEYLDDSTLPPRI
jgi:DNA-binding NarL/FixJ family response regulator